MATITIEVYEFDSLSENAKETARQWYREGMGMFDLAECSLDDAQAIGALMGITLETDRRNRPVVWYDADRGDASFGGSYSYAIGSVKAVKDYAPTDTELHRIAQAFADVQKRNFYCLSANISAGHDCYGMTVEDVFDRRNGYSHECAKDDAYQTITDLLRDFASWIGSQIRDEFEYQNSDEQIDDAITANEYTFTVEGNRF